jgi:hypothetical protein
MYWWGLAVRGNPFQDRHEEKTMKKEKGEDACLMP